MKKKILIAPNSFKECSDSVTVSEYLLEELYDRNDFNLILKPVSDGGDGFLRVCQKNFNLEIISYKVSSPYDESKINCEIGYDKTNKILYIESANVLGLKIIPLSKRNPLKLSSKGMGELLIKILKDHNNGMRKVKKIIIGIGGTGTNDLGLGLFSKFNLKILDAPGNSLEIVPSNFVNARKLFWSKVILPFKIEIITDVDNKLLGENGATSIFGRQKGLSLKQILFVEKGFQNIVNLIKNNKLIDLPNKLSGAGGGLAAGLQIFFNAKVISSKKFIMNELKIKKIKNVNYVITGEGAFDKQSLMEKATGSLVQHFIKMNIPVIICCGVYDRQVAKIFRNSIEFIELQKFFRNKFESIKYFRRGIKLASDEIKRKIIK